MSVRVPRPQLCDRRFELGVDDLVFLGHPTTVDTAQAGGTAEALRGPSGPSWLEELMDPRRGLLGATAAPPAPVGHAARGGGSTIDLFHVALVMPAKTPAAQLNRLYSDVLQPLAALLRHEQVRSNYVVREVELIQSIPEPGLGKGDDDGEQWFGTVGSLARAGAGAAPHATPLHAFCHAHSRTEGAKARGRWRHGRSACASRERVGPTAQIALRRTLGPAPPHAPVVPGSRAPQCRTPPAAARRREGHVQPRLEQPERGQCRRQRALSSRGPGRAQHHFRRRQQRRHGWGVPGRRERRRSR